MTTTKNNIPVGYKDSAVGIIPQEWEVKRVKDIGKVVTGSTPPTTDASNYGNEYMFVSPADLSDRQKYIYCTEKMLSSKGYNKSRKIPKGAVLYTCIGSTIGKIGIAPCELSSNQQINAVICKNDNEYLYYVLLYRTGQIRMLAGEQAVPIINKSDFENIKLAVPPLAEQKKIAEILGVWDEAIEKQNLLIEKLELRKRALMQRLLTGKTRLHGFTEPWQKVKLGEISTIKKGVQVNKNTLQEYGKYPTINGGIDPSGYSDNYNTEANTITISEGGNSCGYVNFITTKFWSGGHCYTITPLNNIKNLYLYHQLKYFEPRIMIQRVGSGLPNIQFNMLIKFECFLPTLLEQTAIAEVLNTADKEIAIHIKTLDALRLQKRGLMQQLLTGKTRVKI
ncbi:MAG: restriction endonuclease subunit S [Bacteroidales bacterium]|nr:restriction endonuclease subunit S [Bacteroidales bacterium]